jgi:outer membrane lipoprotein SlyB
MKATPTFAAVIAAGALISGCASSPSYNDNGGYASGGYATGYNNTASMGYGTIESIQVTQGGARTSGGGAIVGGLVGALAGNQVGSGSGRTAATVAGGVAGAAIGNSVERNRNARRCTRSTCAWTMASTAPWSRTASTTCAWVTACAWSTAASTATDRTEVQGPCLPPCMGDGRQAHDG